jgi:hypothetical protein
MSENALKHSVVATMAYLVGNCGGAGLPFLPTTRGGWGRRRRCKAQASPGIDTSPPFCDRRVDGGVALDGGAPNLVLARVVTAPVEKAVAGLAWAIATPVKKTVDELEKATAGREARWRGRKAGGRARAWWRCWLPGPRPPWRTLRQRGRSGAHPLELQRFF